MYPAASWETWTHLASLTPNACFSKSVTTIGNRLAKLSKYKILWIQTSSKDSLWLTSLKKCKNTSLYSLTAMVAAIMIPSERFKFPWESWWAPKSRSTLRSWHTRVKVNAAPLSFARKLFSRQTRSSRWASTGDRLILSWKVAWACAQLQLHSTSRFLKRCLTRVTLWDQFVIQQTIWRPKERLP